MKEIIFLYSYYGIGGAQRRAANIANYLSARGYKIYIVALLGGNGSITTDNFYNLAPGVELVLLPDWVSNNNNGTVKTVIDSENEKIRRLKKKANVLNLLHIKNSDLSDEIPKIRNAIALKSFMSLHTDAVVVNFGFNIFETAYYALQHSGNKLIYVETNASEKYRNDSNYNSVLKEIKSADGCVFQTKQEMADHSMTVSGNVAIIYNPLNDNLPAPYSGERRKVIVNFCALKRQKNLLLLIKACEKVFTLHPDYELQLYCDSPEDHDSGYAVELREYISSHNLSDRVKLLYMRHDVHDVIKDCAMFVSSSDYEGISNSMIEAMAIGLPVISTDCAGGGAAEMITDGYNGLLVPIKDENAMSGAIIRFIEDNELARKCGNNASLIKNTLSSEKIYGQWADFIERYC